MNIDSVYGESVYEKSPFNTVSKQHLKYSRLRNEKSPNSGHHLMNSPQPKLSIEQIEKEILKQISTTQDTIRKFQEGLTTVLGKNNSINSNYHISSDKESVDKYTFNIDKLRNLEQSIRRKDHTIKQIEEDIKLLKNGTYYDGKQKSQQTNFEKFVNEIKVQRQNLVKVQNLLMSKAREVHNKKQIIKNVQEKYRDKCNREGIQFLSYQSFKEAELKKRKEIKKNQKYRKGSFKKMASSIKQYPSKQKHQQHPIGNNPSNHGPHSKRMKDLLGRKNVTQAAIKNAKKKHNLEINELCGKRDFLLDQNQDLEQKLLLKENQLRTVEQKFSDSRSSSNTKKISERRYKTERNI